MSKIENDKYIKSPLNYTGGKYKLLKEIIPKFPNNINNFIDLFGGGFNVGINVDANTIFYNDSCKQIVDLLNYIKNNKTKELLKEIDEIISKYNLNKENKDGFINLRKYYNEENKSPIVFYTLICYSFNNQIRFNKCGQYNMPFGKDRSFNETLRQKFILFSNEIHKKKCKFLNNNFNDLKIENIKENDFIYADPPYYNSVASYNENGGWNIDNEKQLLNMLDKLNSKNIKFALSNNLKYDNELLKNWIKKYNVYYLGSQYNNCNYHKKDKTKDIEILVTNY